MLPAMPNVTCHRTATIPSYQFALAFLARFRTWGFLQAFMLKIECIYYLLKYIEPFFFLNKSLLCNLRPCEGNNSRCRQHWFNT
jgi:hypothetical protein